MSGYNYEAGMSNNAVSAYNNGLVPASKIKGISAALVQKFCRYEEWHHSSGFYNRVKFYCPLCVTIIFGKVPGKCEDHGVCECDPQAVEALAQSQAVESYLLKDQYVEWIEWTGSRKHPKANPRIAENCTIVIKGQTATVYLPDDSRMTKRLTTNGFSFRDMEVEV